ncbi:MAG: NADH-quinone oxidoreductase subunit C [Longimicrobiaceae bacterium]
MGSDKDTFKEGLGGLEAGVAKSPEAAPGAPLPAAEVPPHPSVQALGQEFADVVLRHEVVAGDEHVVFIPRERVRELLGWLRDEPSQGYDFLKDITGVDYGDGVSVQVVYELWSITHRRQLRVKVEVPLKDASVDSVYDLWRAADWLERETYDMFGVVFDGHPDLRRILMPYNYSEGYPLRKDFPLRGRFSRAEQTRRALALKVEDHYSPYELELAERLGQPLPDVFGEDVTRATVSGAGGGA